MKSGDSGKYWYINEKGGFVSTYNFSDYNPPSDIFGKLEVRSAEIVELPHRDRQDLNELPKVA